MSLIKVEKIVEECTGLGRAVERAVLNHPPHKLSDEELEEITAPHVSSLIHEGQKNMRDAVEEELAIREDERRRDHLQDMIQKRKNNIQATYQVEVFYNDKKTFKARTETIWNPNVINDGTTSYDDESESQPQKKRRKTLEINNYDAPNDLTAVSDHEFLEHETESSHWNDFRPVTEILAESPYDKFYGCGHYNLVKLLKENAKSPEDAIDILTNLNKYGSNFTHCDTTRYLEFAELMQPKK